MPGRLARLIWLLALALWAAPAAADPVSIVVSAVSAISGWAAFLETGFAALSFSWGRFAVGLALSAVTAGMNRQNANAAAPAAIEMRNRQHIVRSTVANRNIVYGRAMVSGPVVYAEVTAEKNSILHLIVAIAGHEVDAIEEVWLGDYKVGNLNAAHYVVDGHWARDAKYDVTETWTVPVDGIVTLTEQFYYRATKVVKSGAELTDVTPNAPASATEYAWNYRNQVILHPSLAGASVDITYQWRKWQIRCWTGLGTSDQRLPDELTAACPGWTAEHRLQGVAWVYVQLRYLDTNMKFASGIPNVKALVRGKKVFDPRSGLTAWSNNWALVVRDYLSSAAGLSCAEDELHDDSFTAAANICDERVSVMPRARAFTADRETGQLAFTDADPLLGFADGVRVSSDGTLPAPLDDATTYYAIRVDEKTIRLAATVAEAHAGTGIDLADAGDGNHTLTHADQVRYCADGNIDTGEKPISLMQKILTAAAGAVVWTGGQYRCYAGAYVTPTLTFGASDLRGALKVQPRTARKDLYNGVKGVFADPQQGWQPADFPVVKSSAYAALDGGQEILRDIELPFTINSLRAQRIAKLHLAQSRNAATMELPLKLSGLRLRVWDTFLFDLPQLGYDAKVFRVVSWKLSPAGGVDLTVQEESADAYAWTAADGQEPHGAHDTTLPDPFTTRPPGTPEVTETLYETTGSAGVKSRATIAWAASGDPFLLQYEVAWKAAGDDDTAWASLPLVPAAAVTATLYDTTPGTYDFRVRAINALGVPSAWVEATAEIHGLAAVPGDVAGFAVIKSAGFALARWDLSADLDVRLGGRVILRYASATSGATWNDGVNVGEVAGGATSATLPLRTGTYLAKFQDSSGQWSATAASFTITEGTVTGWTTKATVTESPTFPGTKTSVEVSAGALQLTAGLAWDSVSGLMDTWTDVDGGGGVAASGSYAFSAALDCTTVATRRFQATLTATRSDTGDKIDARLEEIDAWGLFDGSVVDDCDATLYIAITNDNPAGSPTWGDWAPFVVGDFTCRAAKFRLDLASGATTHNIAVSALAVTAYDPA